MLSANHLDDIEQEVRQCFIQEDAPDYLADLESGILHLCNRDAGADADDPGWRELLRAAHTLKGGAGLAQLYGLSTLTHRVEDLLIAVRDRRLPLMTEVEAILLQSIDELRRLLEEAALQPSADPASSLLPQLEVLLSDVQALPEEGLGLEALESTGGVDPVKLVLESDFQQLLATTQVALDRADPVATVLDELRTSCQMLAEVLNLPWLKRCVFEMDGLLTQEDLAASQVEILLKNLEQARLQVLAGEPPQRWGLDKKEVSEPQTEAMDNGLAPSRTQPDSEAAQPSSQAAPTQGTSSGAKSSKPDAQEINLRVPVTQLNRLNEVVGEMLISYERLKLDQQRLDHSNQDMRRRSRQFYRIREQIQDAYDQLLLPLQGQLQGQLPNAQPYLLQSGVQGEFDALQLDRFSGIHSLLQDFQELVTRLEENANDIALFSRGSEESLGQLREQMQGLQEGLVATRLRPFSMLAERFRRPLWNLTQRFDKQAELQVEGTATLMDRAILDQLYEPLLHLIRNAFDHGIESPQERQRLGKATQATIRLAVAQSGTQTTLTLSDDGRGINFERVHQKAKQAGLLGPQRPNNKTLTELLFTSGFSTAQQVGELSGRGVGLDVVKAEVEALRGQIQVQSQWGKGTRFVITVPLSLNILSLLTCQGHRSNGQKVTLAIPSIQILDFVQLDSANRVVEYQQQHLLWREQRLALYPASEMVPLNAVAAGFAQTRCAPRGQTEPTIGIVLEVGEERLAIAVDQLLQEKEMVLKPFDTWLPPPPHLSGCTILASGEVVPVLKPEALPLWLMQLAGDAGPTRPNPSNIGSSNNTQPDLEDSHEGRGPIRILVVDDSMTARRWLVRSLQRLGYDVVQCRDGQEAWEQLLAEPHYDLVISDVEMPRLDGFGLLSRIRKHRSLAALPVALLTSRQSDRHIAQAQQLGATGYYTKPLGNQTLLRELGLLLIGNPVGLLAPV